MDMQAGMVYAGRSDPEGVNMTRASLALTRFRQLWQAREGQDMIEYALMAAAVAIVIAGFLPPQVMPAISTIFSKITSGMSAS